MPLFQSDRASGKSQLNPLTVNQTNYRAPPSAIDQKRDLLLCSHTGLLFIKFDFVSRHQATSPFSPSIIIRHSEGCMIFALDAVAIISICSISTYNPGIQTNLNIIVREVATFNGIQVPTKSGRSPSRSRPKADGRHP